MGRHGGGRPGELIYAGKRAFGRARFASHCLEHVLRSDAYWLERPRREAPGHLRDVQLLTLALPGRAGFVRMRLGNYKRSTWQKMRARGRRLSILMSDPLASALIAAGGWPQRI